MKNISPNYLRLFGIVIFIAILIKIDMKYACLIIKEMNIGDFCYAFLLVIPVFFISALRWYSFLKLQNIHYPFLSALLVNQTSQFISFISPGRIGELIKVWYLKKDQDISYIKSTISVLVPRIMDATILIFCCIFGFSMLSIHIRIIIIAGIIVSILIFLSLLKTPVIQNKLMTIAEAYPFFANLKGLSDEVSLISSFKLIYCYTITLVLYLLFFHFCYYLSESVGLNINFNNILFVVSVGNVLSFLPISIAGIGTRDASYVLLLSSIGKSQEEAIVFSNLVLICFYLFGGILGLISYLIKPIELKKAVI